MHNSLAPKIWAAAWQLAHGLSPAGLVPRLAENTKRLLCACSENWTFPEVAILAVLTKGRSALWTRMPAGRILQLRSFRTADQFAQVVCYLRAQWIKDREIKKFRVILFHNAHEIYNTT